MYCFSTFPWDLEDEGLDAALGRLAGEIGVDAVCVTAVHPGIHELRGRVLGGRWTFQCGSAAHFQPDTKFYATGRIRPIAAAWMKSRNPLERIAKVAERERLKLRVSLACCAGREMVERYTHAACVNAFGDASADRLCPSNPEVRAYVAAIVEDISTNYPVETIEVVDADFGDGAWPANHANVGFELSSGDASLLSWCFCASCRQRAADAGILPDAVMVGVHDRLAAAARLEMQDARTLEEVITGRAELAAFQRMRIESVASLARSLRSKTTCRIVYRLDDAFRARAMDAASLAPSCDAVSVRLEGGRIDPSLRAELATYTTDRVEVRQTCYPPQAPDGPSLVAATHEASKAGYAGILFDNYGLAPEPCLDWVRQAIRYARREGGQ